ncbi:hypothetical protein [Segeticoccus rhizosphaerae]|uniref:hypothetical protein n=1 Tax=Segeticoccus rhizosphaerae TaxID=1104777 RepID=UPI0010C0AC48|nr:hypothetical protein [Ornithinicoccus soli]
MTTRPPASDAAPTADQGRQPHEREFPRVPGQVGLATRRQLRDRGWRPKAVRHRLAHTWQLVYPRLAQATRGDARPAL